MASEPDKKLACLLCRQRKVACDRRRPKCGLCAKGGFDCQYKPREHRPGLRAGYVAQLEKRLEQLERRMDEVVCRLPPEAPREDLGADDARTLHLQTVRLPENMGTESQGTFHAPLFDGPMENNHHPASPSSQMLEGLEFNLQALWLENYHSWLPILHNTSIRSAFTDDRLDQLLVRKAIMAVTIWDAPGMAWEQKQVCSQRLYKEIILDCIGCSTLRSVQALLILSMLHWGKGKWCEYSNLIAMCKRMSQGLKLSAAAGATGLQSAVSTLNPGESFGTNIEIDHEERLRTFWMIEMIDNVFALNVEGNISSCSYPLQPRLPCSDRSWASRAPVQEERSFNHLQYSSGFSMCVHLCTTELEAVRQFQQAARESRDIPGSPEWQTTAQRLDERLTIWREEFVAAVFRLINAVSSQSRDSRGEMEPFIVLTNCFLNMGVITLLQAQSSMPEGVSSESEPWAYANHRCMYACENMAAKIRRMDENELKSCSPWLVLAIFVAARFYIVHTKCLQADVSVNLHSLAYSLHICSHHWPLAKMFEAVIRTAVAEHRTPVLESALPMEFYDLRFPVIEICPLLQRWADNSWIPVPSDI